MFLKRITLALLLLYCLYLLKSGFGINLSARYSAPEALKFPLRAVPYTALSKDRPIDYEKALKKLLRG